jgi:hypothetical protein
MLKIERITGSNANQQKRMLYILMAKLVEQCFLYEYVAGELTLLSKPFKSKKLAEKEREKYSEKERRKIGLGLIRVGQRRKEQ